MEKHAYLIMAHTDFKTLIALLSCIDDERNDIYLHVDKKSKNVPWLEIKKIIIKAQLYILKSESIRWGSYRQIKCEVALLKAATSHDQYAYYHLLSGSDLPLKNQDYLHQFYDENQGKEYIQFVNENMMSSCNCYERIRFYSFFQGFSKHRNYFVRLAYALFNAISIHLQMLFHFDRNRKLKQSLAFGANWFSITNDLANYVVSQEQWVQKHFRFTRCADELFLQMLVYNSGFYKQVYHSYAEDNFNGDPILRKIDWQRGNPYIYKIEDLNELLDNNFLFARKFNSDVDFNVVDSICKAIKKQ